MPNATLDTIQKGWKVFAGSEEVGEVMEVGSHDISVRRGTILRHEFRVPEEYVVEAADGVVDLNADRATIDSLEAGMPVDDGQ
jgi:hypothetical protein